MRENCEQANAFRIIPGIRLGSLYKVTVNDLATKSGGKTSASGPAGIILLLSQNLWRDKPPQVLFCFTNLEVGALKGQWNGFSG
jgi:hypothetical protein